MTFAAQFEKNGTLNRVIMPKLNCPEAEGILGGILRQDGPERRLSKRTAAIEDGWYRGQLNFTVGG